MREGEAEMRGAREEWLLTGWERLATGENGGWIGCRRRVAAHRTGRVAGIMYLYHFGLCTCKEPGQDGTQCRMWSRVQEIGCIRMIACGGVAVCM